MVFMDLEKAYDRINREVLWKVLRLYEVGGKLLNKINSIYVNSLAYVKVKRGERECFRIEVVRNRGVSYPIGFSMYVWTK